MTLRFTPSRFALSYIALGALAIALLAVPLWLGFQGNVGTFRAYVAGAEMERFVSLFHRDGPRAVAAAIEAYATSLPPGEVAIFADPQKQRLAGNLPRWPGEVPDVPGTYGLMLDVGGGNSMRLVTSHVTLPGGYLLLMGRESVRFDTLIARFWYGIAGAAALVLTLGLVFAWLLRRAHDELEGLVAQRTAQLRSSEERYARAMEATAAGHWEWDLVANEVFHSPRFRELYGVPLDERFASRDDWKARQPVSPGERERQEQALQAAIADPAKGYDIELSFEVRPGEVRWLRSRGKVFRAEDGRPLRVAGATSDITAQKLAQEALQRSEERYARALQASNDGIWEWNPATDAMFMSERARELWGVPDGAEVRTRAELKKVGGFHPEDLQRTEDAIAANRAPGARGFDLEYRVITPGGEVRWVRSQGKAFPGADGRPAMLTGSLTDITERKRAEEALRESEKRYERVMLAAEAGFWDWDVPADEFYVSPKLLEMTDFAPGTRFAGRADFMTRAPFHPGDRTKWERAVKELFASGDSRLAMEVRSIHGSETRWALLSGLCVRDAAGKVLRWTGSATDITAGKRAEMALRLSEERYARVMQASEDGFWEWVVATDEFYASPRMLAIYGLPQETVFRSRADFLSRFPFHPEDLELWRKAVAAHLAGETARIDLEVRANLQSETRWLHLAAICLRDASGAEERWTGSVSDVTERRRAQEALRVSEERYARAMEGSGAGHWDWNIVSDEMFVSEHAREMLALPAGALPARRAEIMALVPMHPDDRAAMSEAVKQGIESGIHERDYRVMPRPGEVRWLRTRAKVYKDERGAAVRMTGSLIDITERRLAADALRASEQRYSLAMEASDEGHFDTDLETGEMFVSPRLNEIYGFPRDANIVNRVEFLNQIPFHPDDRHLLADIIRPDWEDPGRDLYEFECRIVPRPGETRWIHTRGKVTRDADGRARRRVGVVADITARKHAEEALRLSEERYALAVAGASDGIWDEDLTTGMLYRSPRNQEMVLGRPSDGIDVRRRAEWAQWHRVHPDDAPKRDAAIRAHLEGRTPLYEIEYRVRHPDGTHHWIHARGVCTRDASGRALRIAGSTTNIDARKAAEEALRLSEKRYALAMEVAEEGHFDWNVQTDEIFASAQALRVIGVPPDAEYRTRADVMARVRYHPDDEPRMRAQWRAALDGRGVDQEFEYRVLRGVAEEPRWVRGRWKVFRDEAGVALRVIGIVTDVTERKLAADELRESEARFRALTELWSDWYWRQDETLRFTYSSAAINPPDGYPGGSSIGKARWELPGIVPLSSSWAEHQAVLAAHKPFRDFEYSRPAADGTLRYISTSGTPIFDEQGNFKGYQGTGRNITERKRIEDELRQSEARFRSLTELSSDWYWEQDENLRFTYLSNQAAALTGYSGESSVGKTRWEIANMTPLTCSWAEHQAVLAAREPFRDLECRRVGPDGTVRYLSISGAPIFDAQGRFRGYRGIGRNITERKRIEEELRSRQEMLELAQKSARAIAFEWRIGADGPDRNRWSPELAAMYGLGPEAYDGSFEQWKKLIHPEDWPAVTEAIKHAQRTGEVSAEYRVVHPDASVHWLHARGRMFFDAAGTAVRMVGFMHDVTERRRAEEELKAMERKLRQAQRLEAMGTLAGGIAHDFNNILGAILGYGEMALRDAPKGSRLRRDLDSIVTAGERGRALVDRVLAFSRSGVGERVPVHVEKVVREALDLVSAKLPPDVTLHAKLHTGRAAMLGDATQVHQLLMNLATNAVQAMPGGGTLRVSLRALRLEAARAPTIGILDPGDYLVLEVSDTGTGIAPEILDRIFDPFFTTKEVGTGTGLGLSLVHGIVAEVGGAIEVASTVGSGSTFTVYLPRNGEAVDNAKDEEPQLPRGEGQRVLIVDDEELLVKLATRTLEELGYAPVGFTSSAAALAAFRADPQRFDALITDERMPGMSGSALIREVRGIRDRIPVVLMSGFVSGAAATRAREAGAEEVLKKPLSARDLAASLARVLDI